VTKVRPPPAFIVPDDDATLRIRAAYDAVDYEAAAYPASHPDRLATLAMLLGVDPPALPTCRVLEIGCADGSNVLPIAAAWPGAMVVGCDLAPRPLKHGRRLAQDLGLANVTLLHADVRALPADLGSFDYIIAQGFYSWVPPDVRDTLLALISARLSPTGVAFVSYNALPGSRIRQIAWDALHYHTDHIDDPRQRLAAARALLRALAEPQQTHWKADGPLRAGFGELVARSDSALLHDDLAQPNDAFYFHEFEAHARRHGLAYLGDAEPHFIGGGGLSPVMKQVAAQYDRITAEQYLDFARLCRFRQSLLTKAPSASNFQFVKSRVAGLHAAAAPSLIRLMAEAEQQGKSRASLLSNRGEPLAQQLLLWLADVAPRTVSFADVVAWRAQHGPGNGSSADALLGGLYVGGVVDLYLQPFAITTEPPERPVASPVARAMARTRTRVVNLRHEMVHIDDTVALRLLTLLDGTRDRAMLQEMLGRDCSSQRLEALLRFFGKVALLAG